MFCYFFFVCVCIKIHHLHNHIQKNVAMMSSLQIWQNFYPFIHEILIQFHSYETMLN